MEGRPWACGPACTVWKGAHARPAQGAFWGVHLLLIFVQKTPNGKGSDDSLKATLRDSEDRLIDGSI